LKRWAAIFRPASQDPDIDSAATRRWLQLRPSQWLQLRPGFPTRWAVGAV